MPNPSLEERQARRKAQRVTVAQLMEMLQRVEPHKLVVLDGCDCEEYCGNELRESAEEVTLLRTDHCSEPEEWK